MSLSTSEKCEKNNSLSIPEILADFFLRKIDMPKHSDDSDHKHKNKRKKSKHKKRKHKKSKHSHRDDSSDSSSRSSYLNSKNVVEDVSSSEEMGIRRLKKIKNMKLQSANNVLSTVTTSDDQQVKVKSDVSNSYTSKNLVFYGPSLELLLTGVESNNSETTSKVDVENISTENNIGIGYDLNKKETSFGVNIETNLGRENNCDVSSDLSVPLPVDNDEVRLKIIHVSVPVCEENDLTDYKISISKNCIHSDVASYSNQIESLSGNMKLKKDCTSSEKSKKDIQNDSNPIVKQKCDGKKKKHSRSRSRSKSQSKKHNSSKSKHKKRASRSSSRDSHHSHKKRKKYSRSRSHSREKLKSHERKRRSHSRSRSRSRYGRHKQYSSSRSPHERHNHRRSRSRSQSYTRHRKQSDSRARRHSYSKRRDRSLSKCRYESKSNRKSSTHSRSRSKSKQPSHSKEKSRSRSKSHEKKSSQSNTKIDQAKILETARKNVLKMMKNGTLPEGLPVENLKKEQLISIQAGGKSVQELTDFCQRLSQKENDIDGSDNEEEEDKPDDETGFIHHPFKVKEPGMIKLNIKNAVQLPIKTHAQKVAETARLSSQFPVSSGNQHKQKELEWIPVVPASTKSETKLVESKVSTNADSNKTVVVLSKTPVTSVSPPVSSIQTPVSYPSPSPEPSKVKASVVEPLIPPPLPPPPLPPTPQPSLQSSIMYQMPIQPVMPSCVTPSQEVMSSYTSASASVLSAATSIFKPPKKLDIPAIVAKRFQALTKLQQNPNDPDALKTVQDAQESIQEWVESQQVPGLFTGSTDAKVLTAAELCGPKYHKFRKDILSHAPPVTEGKGMSLLKKMGWNPGEGLGKNKEGSLEPLMLDIKMDKKGLVSEGENSKKGTNSFTKELQGKHPVSALMELCSKRRWKPPLYTCVLDHGPPHRKLFCFKVEVNGVEYQPLNPCSNKKVAKADSAILCLQSLNILSKTV